MEVVPVQGDSQPKDHSDHEGASRRAREAAPADNFFLNDGASGSSTTLSVELEEQRVIASDPQKPLSRRLEAYEDIVDSEVGDTPLVRARNVERQLGWRQIFLKFEGGNPTGAQKDRIAFAQSMDALRRGFDTLTVATCGNYGAAIALACSLAGVRCVICVPADYHTKRIGEMTALGAEIIRTATDYEGAVQESRARAEAEEWYDANPGGANEAIQLRAYAEIAFEIYDELRDAPAAVAVPVSNGTTLAGIYRGFVSLYRRGKTSRIPKMVAGSTFRKNPIVQAWIKGSPNCLDLAPDRVRGTAVNEPLVNWQSIDGDLALEAVRASQGWAGYASDKSMLACARMIRDQEGLAVLPAATAGLLAMADQHKVQPFPGDRYVAVLTGRKS